MFHSPEEALAVAFTITELPIEPKNATQLIVEALRERHGLEMRRQPSGLTPHDWHAQAVMVLQFAQRTLASRPDLWRVILGEFNAAQKGAIAIQELSQVLMPDLDGTARLVADFLVMRQLRRKPALGCLAKHFAISERTLARREQWWRDQITPLRCQALEMLDGPMRHRGLVNE